MDADDPARLTRRVPDRMWSSNVTINRVISVLALGAVALTACGGSDTKTIETKDGKITVNGDGKNAKVTINGENGNKVTFNQSKVPADFPSAVPLPKGLKLKSAASGGDGSRKVFSLGYTLGSQEPADAVAGYKDQLDAAGFKVNAPLGGASKVSTLLAGGNGWNVIVAAGGSTSPVLTISVTSAN